MHKLIFEITFHSLLKCVPGILKSFRSANNTFVTIGVREGKI
jgi:hypothetical protein